jgi:hypothetical protein
VAPAGGCCSATIDIPSNAKPKAATVNAIAALFIIPLPISLYRDTHDAHDDTMNTKTTLEIIVNIVCFVLIVLDRGVVTAL